MRELRSKMRIAIDGTMSSGKTTLFEALRKSVLSERFAFVPEASRRIAGEFGVTSMDDWKDLLADDRKLNEFFMREEEWLLTYETDKCVVDSSFFLIQAYRHYFTDRPITEHALWPHYDLVLFCEPPPSGKLDGFRFLTGRMAIHELYLKYRPHFLIDAFERLSPTVDRTSIAIDYIIALENRI
jgi:nicotinamide riboside kinase